MRLTATENREAIKRYGHIRPASGRSSKLCATICPGTSHTCTRMTGHGGPHVAHGFLKRVVAVWDSGSGPRVHEPQGRPPSVARPKTGLRTGSPIGLRTKSPRGFLEAIRDRVVGVASSWEEIAFVALFIVFVKFALDILMNLH